MRMMYKKMMIGLSLAAAVFSVSAQNLIPMPVSVRLDSQPGVKYVADKTANTQKMLVEKYKNNKAEFVDEYLDKFDWNRLSPFGD